MLFNQMQSFKLIEYNTEYWRTTIFLISYFKGRPENVRLLMGLRDLESKRYNLRISHLPREFVVTATIGFNPHTFKYAATRPFPPPLLAHHPLAKEEVLSNL